MSRQKELLDRAAKCHRINKTIGGPPLQGFKSVLEAIQSNEPNNLAKAARVLDLYEANLRNLLLQKKAAQKNVSPPAKTIKLPPTTPRPIAPPKGLTPPPPHLQPGTTLEVKGTPPRKVVGPEPTISLTPQVELTAGQRAGMVLMPSGSTFLYRGLSRDGHRRILAAHNRHRRKWQKYDDGVRDLVLSADLTRMAQAYAEKLVLANEWHHSAGRADVGENLANLTGGSAHSTRSPEEVVDDWYDEIKDYNYQTLDAFKSGVMVGHFTQVISRRSTSVGAGVAKSATTLYEVWVCNYAPHGNMTVNGVKQFIDTSRITARVFAAIKSQK